MQEFRLIDFSKFSSVKIGSTCNVLVANNTQDLSNYTIIGGANNLLVSNTAKNIAIFSKNFDYIRLENEFLVIGAAAKAAKIHKFCKEHNLGGLEFLASIPGTLGGLVKMNAGMKEAEIFNNLEFVKLKDKLVEKRTLNYGYRFFDTNLPITEARFLLKKPFLLKEEERFKAMRQNQPKGASFGSVFKNPQNQSAGKLLDLCGLKGTAIGGVKFSEIHANFLINFNNGSFNDAICLIDLAKKEVLQQFGIKLELEVKII